MNYKLRREKLLEMLPEYSITVMYSGVAPYSIGDEKYPFKVDRSFYYFTGIERENLYLVLIKLSAAKSSEMLFIEPFDEKEENTKDDFNISVLKQYFIYFKNFFIHKI